MLVVQNMYHSVSELQKIGHYVLTVYIHTFESCFVKVSGFPHTKTSFGGGLAVTENSRASILPLAVGKLQEESDIDGRDVPISDSLITGS